MVKFSIGHKAKMHGFDIGNDIGVNTWAAFAGTDEDAVVVEPPRKIGLERYASLEVKMQPSANRPLREGAGRNGERGAEGGHRTETATGDPAPSARRAAGETVARSDHAR